MGWRKAYKEQSVLGSRTNPRFTPQKPGKVAMTVALAL